MDRAIVGVCFDSRQRRILDNTLPWRRYEERHGIPVRVVERDYAGGDSYWNKHLLFRNPELRSFKYLMFLDNDVFANAEAEPLLKEWDSPLIGATFESTQASWSPEVIDRYYDEYFVDRRPGVSNLQIINTRVLILPREQSDFLEVTYRRWKAWMASVPRPLPRRKDPFVLAADQPHVSYALQAEKRYKCCAERFNTLWWHWYKNNAQSRHQFFLFRSKAAALSLHALPKRLWRAAFHHERVTFARALASCDFLHVAGSKSPVFLDMEPRPEMRS